MSAFRKAVISSIVAWTSLATGSGVALATNYTIDWLNMSPTPFGSTVPNNSTFNLPGVGAVLVTYSYPANYTQSRSQNPDLQNGNLTYAGDNYAWTNQELFNTITSQDPFGPVPWRITYTFPGTLPAGTIVLGVAGLGQTTSYGGGASTATVNQNGAFLGDWSGAGGPWGPTQFTAGPPFQMQNSQTGAGGYDPWWNTPLGVVLINDPISSLTVDFGQLRGDGIGLNIGSVVPEPSSAILLGLGATFALIRRRR